MCWLTLATIKSGYFFILHKVINIFSMSVASFPLTVSLREIELCDVSRIVRKDFRKKCKA